MQQVKKQGAYWWSKQEETKINLIIFAFYIPLIISGYPWLKIIGFLIVSEPRTPNTAEAFYNYFTYVSWLNTSPLTHFTFLFSVAFSGFLEITTTHIWGS